MPTSTSTDIFERFDLSVKRDRGFWWESFSDEQRVSIEYKLNGLWIANDCILLHEDGQDE